MVARMQYVRRAVQLPVYICGCRPDTLDFSKPALRDSGRKDTSDFSKRALSFSGPSVIISAGRQVRRRSLKTTDWVDQRVANYFFLKFSLLKIEHRTNVVRGDHEPRSLHLCQRGSLLLILVVMLKT